MKTAAGFLIATVFLAQSAFASSITGKITFEGEAPKFKEIKMDADPQCMSFHKDPVFPQALVLGEGNGMANVIIRVKNPPKVDAPVPTEPYVLDQKGCNYHPHVNVIRVGQKVKILNPDGTLHNVHSMGKVNPEFNVAMPKFKTEIERVYEKPEPPFAIKCDVHPWMLAWVMVTDNPFTVVTNENGQFEIKDLPDGTYEVEAWHEKLGAKSGTVTIAGGTTQSLNLSFSVPTKG